MYHVCFRPILRNAGVLIYSFDLSKEQAGAVRELSATRGPRTFTDDKVQRIVMAALKTAHPDVHIPQDRTFKLVNQLRLACVEAAPHAPDPAPLDLATENACEFVLGVDGSAWAFMIVSSHRAASVAPSAAGPSGTMVVSTIRVPGAPASDRVAVPAHLPAYLQMLFGLMHMIPDRDTMQVSRAALMHEFPTLMRLQAVKNRQPLQTLKNKNPPMVTVCGDIITVTSAGVFAYDQRCRSKNAL